MLYNSIEGFVDPILINRFNRAVENSYGMQRTLGNSARSFDPRRNLYDECGFPDDAKITPESMYDLYKRDPIASRVVEIWAKECWQVTPEIYEDENPNIQTPFEIAWDNLGKSLVSEPGYFSQEQGSSIWEYLLRADIMCGIGRYGVVFLGTDDGAESLAEPLIDIATRQKMANLPPYKLMFLRVFPERFAQITKRETSRKSPRYGQPTEYNITFDSVDESGGSGGAMGESTKAVHWTRVVHIVDNIESNEVFGEYRIKPVLNEVLTCQKPAWGSGEMYWKGAAPKISFETHPQLGGDVNVDTSRMKTQIERVINGLEQYWQLSGMTAKPIAPQAVDPTPYIDAPIRRICIKLGIPIPVFMGYEVGENAGTMNSEEWASRVKQSQNGQRSPRVIAPVVNRFINLGLLPVPSKGYKIEWPNVSNKSEKEQAQVGAIRTAAIANYMRSDLKKIIPPVQFCVEFLGMTEERAKSIISEVEAAKIIAQPTTTPGAGSGTETGTSGGGTGEPRIATGETSGLAGTEVNI